MRKSTLHSSQEYSRPGVPQPPINNLEAQAQGVIDEDEELLLLYLLPSYKKLTVNNKREALHQCYSILNSLCNRTTTNCNNTTNFQSVFPINIKLEHSTPVVKEEPIFISDSEQEDRKFF